MAGNKLLTALGAIASGYQRGRDERTQRQNSLEELAYRKRKRQLEEENLPAELEYQKKKRQWEEEEHTAEAAKKRNEMFRDSPFSKPVEENMLGGSGLDAMQAAAGGPAAAPALSIAFQNAARMAAPVMGGDAVPGGNVSVQRDIPLTAELRIDDANRRLAAQTAAAEQRSQERREAEDRRYQERRDAEQRAFENRVLLKGIPSASSSSDKPMSDSQERLRALDTLKAKAAYVERLRDKEEAARKPYDEAVDASKTKWPRLLNDGPMPEKPKALIDAEKARKDAEDELDRLLEEHARSGERPPTAAAPTVTPSAPVIPTTKSGKPLSESAKAIVGSLYGWGRSLPPGKR